MDISQGLVIWAIIHYRRVDSKTIPSSIGTRKGYQKSVLSTARMGHNGMKRMSRMLSLSQKSSDGSKVAARMSGFVGEDASTLFGTYYSTSTAKDFPDDVGARRG